MTTKKVWVDLDQSLWQEATSWECATALMERAIATGIEPSQGESYTGDAWLIEMRCCRPPLARRAVQRAVKEMGEAMLSMWGVR